MKRIIGVLILWTVSSAFGQEATPRVLSLQNVTKVITLKYPGTSTNILEGWGLMVKRSGEIVVVIGPQDKVDTAEAILKQMDVPPPARPAIAPKKDIQLTAYLIIASPNGVPGAALPKDLEPAVSQVASILPYKSFNLFDAVMVRVADGDGGMVAGVLPQGQQTFPSGGSFILRLRGLFLTEASPVALLRINSFDLAVSIVRGLDREGHEKTQTVNLNTNIDMKEGQKIVVGKANIDGSENALIVILTAKVVD